MSLRQLQWWDERRIVSPRIEGHRRYYEPEEFVEISVLAELRRKGVSLQRCKHILRRARPEIPERWSDLVRLTRFGAELYLVTDGRSVVLEYQASKVIELLKKARGPMFVVCINDHVERIRSSY